MAQDTMHEALESCRRERDAALSEIERLRTIVDKLPKTADGVLLSPTMCYYHPMHSESGVLRSDYCDGFRIQFENIAAGKKNGYFTSRNPSECYSTREAARKAGG